MLKKAITISILGALFHATYPNFAQAENYCEKRYNRWCLYKDFKAKRMPSCVIYTLSPEGPSIMVSRYKWIGKDGEYDSYSTTISLLSLNSRLSEEAFYEVDLSFDNGEFISGIGIGGPMGQSLIIYDQKSPKRKYAWGMERYTRLNIKGDVLIDKMKRLNSLKLLDKFGGTAASYSLIGFSKAFSQFRKCSERLNNVR